MMKNWIPRTIGVEIFAQGAEIGAGNLVPVAGFQAVFGDWRVATLTHSLRANEVPPKPFIKATEAIMKMSPPAVGATCEHCQLRVFSWLVVFRRAITINYLQ